MKKQFQSIFLIVFALIVCQASTVSAQSKLDAKLFLNRTNGIIMKAKGAVEVGSVYTGDIVKSVHHQKFARELFNQGKFNSAIWHSYRARMLAFAAIKANKAKVSEDMQLTKDEKPLIKDMPNEKNLDGEIKIPKDADEKSMIKDKEEDITEEK